MLLLENEAQHLARHWYEIAATFAASGAAWSAIAYGVDSFPDPTNRYGLWAINWLRALLNKKVNPQAVQALANRADDKQNAATTASFIPKD